jgi:hypothetical protein
MSALRERSFWHEAVALHGSVTPRILPYVLAFGAYVFVVCGTAWWIEQTWQKLRELFPDTGASTSRLNQV